ncbi:glycerol-3-phosphate 1-O-acyltransferase PlsB [Pseudoalteromonas ulvae]|uniref:Glycerol-3-phosphate acyltransferase n=1 Tax=Pseudoalteromonas ulvae TaxID=107327 RepID=A0A244CWY7_PSEDV|nr:glycerol-3-phosphate 1-O-acyltransferase PlsB [Pseudoalteromonas ulvae]OUL59759.1 glycerol-3-phosphate 1-O-acyltransferase [Pseudoalteromonas ulvae]
MKFVAAMINLLAKLGNRLFVRTKLLPNDPVSQYNLDPTIPTFYISRLNSASDLAALAKTCDVLNLPNPLKQEHFQSGLTIHRFIALQNPTPIFSKHVKATSALKQGEAIFDVLKQSPDLKIQIIPVTILWGRNPGKEKAGIGTLLSHSLAPSWLRKVFVVLFSGRGNLLKFSQPLDLDTLMKRRADSDELPQTLLRVARFHFKRQKLAATGPKLPSREALFQSLLAAPSVKHALEDEARLKSIPINQAKENAQILLNEIAANYNDAMIGIGDRILTWLWTKLYNGIEIKNAQRIHDLTNKGHEIIYVPCHRSHMDYLLLTYVIYHQGLVPPHIAAGINLNFWPAGPIFRRSGAFFIRRTFKGNKLYSTIFREYLSQLFIKGYSVKFYTEGGRSRTGRLLPPKTGMLAMTLQSMLRGIERPVSLVPVYIGYEHVMEVNTYLKELAGSSKTNESISGIFKTIKNLKNYGHGYVSFGEPINVNQYLNQHQSDWRDNIHPSEVQKPQWLGQQVANIADQVMININKTAALNSVNMLAMVLLMTDKLALSKKETLEQIEFYQALNLDASYSEDISQPNCSANELLTHAIKLSKVTLVSDPLGEIVEIAENEKVLLNYYRNNIIHLFAVPSLLASHILRSRHTDLQSCIDLTKKLYPLFAAEWFMQELKDNYIERILSHFEKQHLIEIDSQGNISLNSDSKSYFKLSLLAKVLDCTMQRYAVVIGVLAREKQIDRANLELKSQSHASRLSKLHDIKTPEFYDKKVLSSFISTLKDLSLITVDDQGLLGTSEQLALLDKTIRTLINPQILVSIEQNVLNHNAAI